MKSHKALSENSPLGLQVAGPCYVRLHYCAEKRDAERYNLHADVCLSTERRLTVVKLVILLLTKVGQASSCQWSSMLNENGHRKLDQQLKPHACSE